MNAPPKTVHIHHFVSNNCSNNYLTWRQNEEKKQNLQQADKAKNRPTVAASTYKMLKKMDKKKTN